MGGVVGRVFREFAVDDLRRDPGLGLRLADADADAVRAHAEGPRAAREARACSARGFDAVFDGMLARLPLDAGRRAEGALLVLLLTIGSVFADACKLYMDVPKGFFPTEDTGLLRGATEGPPDTSFAAMVAAAGSRSTRSCARIPPSTMSTSSIGTGRRQPGLHVHRAEAARPARRHRRRSSRALRRATAAMPGITRRASSRCRTST